jgi:hypothetical protein
LDAEPRVVLDQPLTARFAPLSLLSSLGAHLVALDFAFALSATAAAFRLGRNSVIAASIVPVRLFITLPAAFPLSGFGGSIAVLTQQRASEERADHGARRLAART